MFTSVKSHFLGLEFFPRCPEGEGILFSEIGSQRRELTMGERSGHYRRRVNSDISTGNNCKIFISVEVDLNHSCS